MGVISERLVARTGYAGPVGVVTEQFVEMDEDQGKEPKGTVTVTEYTYDCP